MMNKDVYIQLNKSWCHVDIHTHVQIWFRRTRSRISLSIRVLDIHEMTWSSHTYFANIFWYKSVNIWCVHYIISTHIATHTHTSSTIPLKFQWPFKSDCIQMEISATLCRMGIHINVREVYRRISCYWSCKLFTSCTFDAMSKCGVIAALCLLDIAKWTRIDCSQGSHNANPCGAGLKNAVFIYLSQDICDLVTSFCRYDSVRLRNLWKI